jgi:hypothetical protein
MIRYFHPGSRIPDPDLDFLPISDPGVKKAPDPGVKKAPDPGVKKAPDPGSKSHRIPDSDPQHW